MCDYTAVAGESKGHAPLISNKTEFLKHQILLYTLPKLGHTGMWGNEGG